VKAIFDYLTGHHIKILLYHSISDNHSDPCAVTIENFEAQMRWIKDHGYNVISLKQALKLLNERTVPKRSMVLTVDDGFVDFLENGIPVLTKYDFRATVFIVVSEIGGISSWREQYLNRQLMDWRLLREILDAGYSIGSHGLHHCDLTKVAQEDLDKETIFSKKIIQERLGRDICSFSYPWGICTERELNSVKNAGYDCAVSVGGRWHNSHGVNRFLLERILIEQRDSISTFVKKVK